MTGRPTVLVVDDEAPLRDEICDFLSWKGMTVVPADSVQSALAALAANPAITVVLTDIRMPFASGLTLVETIRQERTAATAVEAILMTGHGRAEDAVTASRAGAFDMLQKPMSLADVLSVVQRAHDKAAARRASVDGPARQPDSDAAAAPPAAAPDVAGQLASALRTLLPPLCALPDLLDTGLPPDRLAQSLAVVRAAGRQLADLASGLIEQHSARPDGRGG